MSIYLSIPFLPKKWMVAQVYIVCEEEDHHHHSDETPISSKGICLGLSSTIRGRELGDQPTTSSSSTLTSPTLTSTSSAFVLNESEIQLSDNERVELMLAPIYQVDLVMEFLNSDTLIKKGLMELKNHLKHTTFTGEFLRKGGLNILQSIIMDQVGNTLSYSLGVFELILKSPEFDWSQLSIKIVEKIVTLFDHNSINISNPALKIAVCQTKIE
ncbi:hypothetical protein DFA_08987 [Cavenderia fasciculata]|uniref:ELMO armadillo-like helical domain-containing protein n=1 Tax=Cavenderia fasciculata TaxID=261658 RepID=F4Q6D9_CACFS|nr:uncharacterized protein DFA_08987 [Cavenderia fasciculata]EGG16449.1 hypothetical protein DFA_08987 [Cavenderia fasciculata]|eukprot:XP_004354849.1 hypothetical protein DFA_08987 [Cavenderia fasciculata]